MARSAAQRRSRGTCRHTGPHTGIGKYSPEFQAMRFVLVCDDCGAERAEIHVEPYVPRFVADPGDDVAAA